MAPTLTRPTLALGPGYLLEAAIGSTEPVNTVGGGVFTDAWDSAWRVLGATEEGHVFNAQIRAAAVEAAEYFYPLQYETEAHEASIEFMLLHISATNMKLAMNGGAITTSGTGATTKSSYEPPAPGTEIRKMIGWESRDSTERLVLRQCFQSGQVQVRRRKGAANKAAIPLTFSLEEPTTGSKPWLYVTAGTARV